MTYNGKIHKRYTGHQGPLVYIIQSSAENYGQIIFHKEQKRSGNPKIVPGKKQTKKKVIEIPFHILHQNKFRQYQRDIKCQQ